MKIFFIIYVFFVSFCFNYYAYEIMEFNSSVRNLLILGKPYQRTFDEKGLPISYSPKIGKFISPFYVVHYAIIYSDCMNSDGQYKGEHWKKDPSIKNWNVPPKLSNCKDKFKNSVDWLINNLDTKTFRQPHYLYNFDWIYDGYDNGMIKAPWWSGLTDAYAIIPLLRAYDVYKDEKYYKDAVKLYNSVLTPYKSDGSLTHLNNSIWIEEYAQQGINEKSLPFVLNGMIYATYGIDAIEKFSELEKPIAEELYDSILRNLYLFDNSGWSMYDQIKTPSNIKYHNIHVGLLSDLLENHTIIVSKEKNDALKIKKKNYKIFKSWEAASDNPGYYFLLYGKRTIAYYHFVFTYIIIVIAPLLINIFKKYLGKKS